MSQSLVDVFESVFRARRARVADAFFLLLKIYKAYRAVLYIPTGHLVEETFDAADFGLAEEVAPLGELELWSSFLFVVSRFCSAFTDHPLRFMHSHSLILSSWDPLRRRRHHRDPWKRLDLGSFVRWKSVVVVFLLSLLSVPLA